MNYSKHFFLILFLFVAGSHLAAGQENENKSYKIEIAIDGLEDSVAYLGYYRGDKRYVLDTAEVAKGRLTFEGEKDIKTGVYFLYSSSYTMDFLIDQSLDFSLKTNRDAVFKDLEVRNSKDNEQFRAFQLVMIDHQKKMKELTSALDSTSTAEDTLTIRSQMQTLNELNATKRDSLLEAFGDTYMSQLLILMRKSPELDAKSESLTIEEQLVHYNYYKDHFFDGVDFNSKGLIRAPNFYGKVKEYMERVTFQHPDSVIASIDYILDQCEDNEELFRYWMGYFFQEYQNAKIMGMDKIFVHLADNYYLNGRISWADSTLLAELNKEMMFQRENQIGLRAPQIYLQDTLNRPANLYGIDAKYLVLFFYDPDCGHCKKKTPVLHELYKKMNGDFEVAAISVTTDRKKWTDFIQKFELDWINLGDLDYKSNFRVQYNVRSTPQVYILDKDKQIIAKKLDIEQIEDFINQRKRIDKLSQ